MSGKVRVYEVARELGIENRALVALFHSVGITEVRNHMSAVAPEQVDRVRRQLEKQSADQNVVEERIRPTVVKRRTNRVATVEAKSSPVAASEPRNAEPSRPGAPPPSAPSAVHAPPPPPSQPVVAAAPPPERTASAEPTPPAEKPAVGSQSPALAPASPPTPTAKPRPAPAPVRAEAQPQKEEAPPARPSVAPKTGIDVWEGRPGVPMPQAPRSAAPRRVQYDAKAGTAGVVGGPRRGGPMMGGRMGRGPRHRGLGSLSTKRIGGPPITQERSAHKKIVRIEESITLQALAAKMSAKAGEVLMKLMSLGMSGVNINSTLDLETANIVANEFGWAVEDVAVSEADQLVAAQGVENEIEDEARRPRPPVVTVMGHVDHGKTSLLDKIRRSQVAAGEAGGITQHIGAYSVETPQGRITFLDTPGHAAFTQMRARGAQTTDICILVVAADDGVMPQTKEALNHAKAAGVPIVVAVNKVDKEDSQPERVRRELSECGLVPEEWGGDTLFCEVSALSGQGIDKLLENVILQAEMLDVGANPDKPATGIVIEAKLDRGRGPVATVLIKEGTLRAGDVALAGSGYGKVRAMLDDRGRQVKEAGPSMPVELIGLSDVPSAGDPVHVVKNIKQAQEIAEGRKTKERRSLMPGTAKISLEELQRALSEANQLDLKVIIKADVQGSLEALVHSVGELNTEKVRTTVVHSGVGAVTEGDVNLAVASRALIIGFNVRPAGKASMLAQREGIEIRLYSVIYDVTDDVRAAMEGLLAPTLVESPLGKAEVRKIFRITKAGVIAGSMVLDGLIRRNAGARIRRGDDIIWEGKVESLKRFKDDVREVKEGYDCGISFENFNDVAEGDMVEAFEMKEVRQKL